MTDHLITLKQMLVLITIYYPEVCNAIWYGSVQMVLTSLIAYQYMDQDKPDDSTRLGPPNTGSTPPNISSLRPIPSDTGLVLPDTGLILGSDFFIFQHFQNMVCVTTHYMSVWLKPLPALIRTCTQN